MRFSTDISAYLLKYIVKKYNIDLIHANSAAAGITAMKYKQRYNENMPVVFTAHGILGDLKKENINLKERWFDVTESKTQAGIRKVPISKKVLPFFEYWYNKNDCEYLLSTPDGKHFEYRNYYDSYWKPLLLPLNMKHRPHDCRHTCVSLLTAVNVDERTIKRIVGHKGQGVTQQVYTHFEIETLLEAIDKI